MNRFEKYVTKQIQVEAIQVQGWANTWLIANRLPAEYRVFYVPRGHEHADRRENEIDSSRGDVLDSAPPYLMVVLDGIYTRVDVGHWLVRGLDGVWVACSNDDFIKLYRKETDHE